MQDIELYKKVLGIKDPWIVTNVQLDLKQRMVTIAVNYDNSVPVACPVCGGQASMYDHQKRRWRHLDTCQLKTIIECEVPLASCEDHEVKQLPVAWAEANGRFTALFEALVISWLKEASISGVAHKQQPFGPGMPGGCLWATSSTGDGPKERRSQQLTSTA
jgi:transposase